MSNVPAIIQERGISTEVWSALKNSLFPGAADESVLMAYDYCAARGLDVMLKPVHLVPMFIKDKNNGDKGSMRDVVMPGIGLYRIQADRAGNYAGMSAPMFGPDVELKLDNVTIVVPEWCEMSVSKIVGDRIVTFTAREYWIENYATAGRDTKSPNAMWQKRPRGQLVKCTEAQALRKGWPELGSQPTAEEMEGKEIEINPAHKSTAESKVDFYPDEAFEKNFDKWKLAVESGKSTHQQWISTLENKFPLTAEQKNHINKVKAPIDGEANEVNE